MKTKLAIGLLSIMMALGTVSCKKTYECHCKTTAGGEEHIDIKAKKESEAASACHEKEHDNAAYSECHLD
jgi:hypothetical protein